MSILNDNVFPNDLLQNSSTVQLSNLDTQQEQNKLIYLNAQKEYELVDPSSLFIPPNIQPGNPNEIIKTSADGNSVFWGKLENDNITLNTINQDKIISLPMNKLTGEIQTDQIGNLQVTDAKINSVQASKITGQIQTDQIGNLQVTDAKINSVDFDKIFNTTNKIITSMIQDSQITQSKMNYQIPARQRYVDFISGQDLADYGYSADKPWKTIQYAIDQISANGFIINILQSSTENLMINNKLQLVLNFCGSEIQNSPNIVLTGHIHIKNSSSIKILNCQIDSSSSVNTHALICESGNNYFKNLSIIGASNKGVYIHAASLYNQFQNCEFPLYFESLNPTQTNLTLVYQNCNITNSISIQNPYILAIDNSILQGITQTQGSLQIYNSNIQGNLSFSSPFPNILSLVGNRFFDQTFTSKNITKTNTGLYCLENNVYNQAGSSFSATRILQQFITNSDISDLAFSKLTGTLQDSQISANTISLNKLKNGTSGKYLKYNLSGILEETDLPTQVTNFNQLQGSLANSQIPLQEITSDKMAINFPQANKFWKYDSNGVLGFVTQSTSVDYSNITNWPDPFGNNSYRVIYSDGFYGKLSYYFLESANSYLSPDYGNNVKLIWCMNKINDDIQQNRFYSIDELMPLLTNKIIPGSKLQDADLQNYGTGFYGKIAGNWQIFRLDQSLFSTLCNSLPIIGWQQLVTENEKSDGQILSYSLADNKLKWINQSLPNLLKGQMLIGNNTNVSELVQIHQYPRIFDNAYLTPNLPVPINMVMTTVLSDQLGFSKISSSMLLANTPAINQILSYDPADNGTLKWINQPASGVSLFSQFQFRFTQPNYERFSVNYDTAYNQSCPRFVNPVGNQCLFAYSNRTPGLGLMTWQNQLCNIMEYKLTTSGESSGYCNNENFTWSYSPANFGGYQHTWIDEDTMSTGSGATQAIVLNSNGTLGVISDERFKQNIQEQIGENDYDYCYEQLDNINVIKFQYNTYNDIFEKCKTHTCSCATQQDCVKKQARLVEKISKIHYGFSAQQWEQTNFKCLTNQYEKNYSDTISQQCLNTCCEEVKQNFEQRKKELIQKNQEQKSLSQSQIITVLWQIAKKQKQLITQQQNEISAIKEILARNNIV